MPDTEHSQIGPSCAGNSSPLASTDLLACPAQVMRLELVDLVGRSKFV
jgi:hypothetical protein